MESPMWSTTDFGEKFDEINISRSPKELFDDEEQNLFAGLNVNFCTTLNAIQMDTLRNQEDTLYSPFHLFDPEKLASKVKENDILASMKQDAMHPIVKQEQDEILAILKREPEDFMDDDRFQEETDIDEIVYKYKWTEDAPHGAQETVVQSHFKLKEHPTIKAGRKRKQTLERRVFEEPSKRNRANKQVTKKVPLYSLDPEKAPTKERKMQIKKAQNTKNLHESRKNEIVILTMENARLKEEYALINNKCECMQKQMLLLEQKNSLLRKENAALKN